MVCPNCGNNNENGAKFCIECGTVLPSTDNTDYYCDNVEISYVKQPVSGAAKGLAIASMACGISGLVISCLWYFFILNATGIILGAIARSKGDSSGMSTAGIICGIVGSVLNTIFFIIFMVAIVSQAPFIY